MQKFTLQMYGICSVSTLWICLLAMKIPYICNVTFCRSSVSHKLKVGYYIDAKESKSNEKKEFRLIRKKKENENSHLQIKRYAADYVNWHVRRCMQIQLHSVKLRSISVHSIEIFWCALFEFLSFSHSYTFAMIAFIFISGQPEIYNT